MQMMRHFNWQVIKGWGKRMAIVFASLYVLDTIYASLPSTPECPVEEHSFGGQKFDVEFCWNHASDRQYIGIRVYSKEGAYLARRWATFAKEGHLNYMAIEDTMIRYSDDTSDLRSASIPEDCVLNMPPTWVDWLEARLPGGIPGVNHCGVVSDEISEKARGIWRIREDAENQKHEQAVREYNARPRAAPPTPAASK
jgi:hypothetical protein